MTDSAAPSPAATASPESGDHHDTKERLLEATLRLFAERGIQGTSMRAVTQAAGTSVSAANYHFGSKEAMLRAALRLRAEPLNRLRIDALEAVLASAERPSVEAVVGAFLRPVFEVRAAAEQGELARNFAARLYMEPQASVAQIRHEVFESVNERFRAALTRALPGVQPETVALGQQLSVAVLVHVVSGNASVSGDEDFSQQPVDAFVAFAAAGIRSLAAHQQPTGSSPAAGDAS